MLTRDDALIHCAVPRDALLIFHFLVDEFAGQCATGVTEIIGRMLFAVGIDKAIERLCVAAEHKINATAGSDTGQILCQPIFIRVNRRVSAAVLFLHPAAFKPLVARRRALHSDSISFGYGQQHENQNAWFHIGYFPPQNENGYPI
jgi:hypothetical protein